MMSAHTESNDANAEILEIRKRVYEWGQGKRTPTILKEYLTSLICKAENVTSVLSSKQNKYNIILE